MSKYVRDTAAGKSISAYVIMKGSREVATVNIHYSNGGRCLVNIWQNDIATIRSLAALGKTSDDRGAYDALRFQSASAKGFGYDKHTAALSGLMIDGHKLTNHCSRDGAPKPPKGAKLYPSDFKVPKGYSLANYQGATVSDWSAGERREVPNPNGGPGFMDCYRDSGLDYLKARGYRVIQAI